jgi:elongation factor 2 kinase
MLRKLIVHQETEENTNKGVDYMLRAAIGGDRQAMMYMAKAYDTAVGLGTKL